MIRSLTHQGTTWVYVDRNDEEAVAYLATNFRFHHLDLEDVKGAALHPKLDVYKHYFFLVTLFPQTNGGVKVFGNELDMFVESNTVLTVTNQPSPFLDKLFERVSHSFKGKEELLSKGAGYLTYKILHNLYADANAPIFDKIGHTLTELEDKIFVRREQKISNVIFQLAILRRNVLELKRIIEPQKLVLQQLVNMKVIFLDKEIADYFDDILDLVNRYSVLLTNYKDIISGFYETHDSLAAHRTTAIIKMLTAISVSFLPLTLIAGLYGMNVINLPLANRSWFAAALFSFVGIFLLGLFIILRKKKWL